MLFYLTALLVVIMDQTSKILIRCHVKTGQFLTVWGIRITHYENSGMAHSLFQGHGRLFALAAVIFVVIVLYYRNKGLLRGAVMDIGMGFMVGGAVGNAIDRILFGKVTDFILQRYAHGVLDLADYAINVGALILIVRALFSFLKNQSVRIRQ